MADGVRTMRRSLQRAREQLSREDLLGFDTHRWVETIEPKTHASGKAAQPSVSRVGGTVGSKIGTKAGPIA
jgi:hypothetical protein